MRTRRPRIPEVARLPTTFHAKRDHVVAITELPNGSTIGWRFESPEHLLETFQQLIEKAALVWPDNEWIKEYLSE